MHLKAICPIVGAALLVTTAFSAPINHQGDRTIYHGAGSAAVVGKVGANARVDAGSTLSKRDGGPSNPTSLDLAEDLLGGIMKSGFRAREEETLATRVEGSDNPVGTVTGALGGGVLGDLAKRDEVPKVSMQQIHEQAKRESESKLLHEMQEDPPTAVMDALGGVLKKPVP